MLYEILLELPPSISHVSALDLTKYIIRLDGFQGISKKKRNSKLKKYFKERSILFNHEFIAHSTIIELGKLPKNKSTMPLVVGVRLYHIGLSCVYPACNTCKRECKKERRKENKLVMLERRKSFRRVIDYVNTKIFGTIKRKTT